MTIRKIAIITIASMFFLLLATIAFAQDETSTNEEKPAVDTSYLDNLPESTAVYTKVEKLEEDNTDSPFYGRYFDPFHEDNFYIDRLSLFNRFDDGSTLNFYVKHTWNSSHNFGIDWTNPEHGRFWIKDKDFNHFVIPSKDPAGRRDLDFGFESGWVGRNMLDISYTQRQSGETSLIEPLIQEKWKSRDVNIKYDFDLFRWDNQIKVRARNVVFPGMDMSGRRNLNFALQSDRNIGDSSFVRGNLAYNFTDLEKEKDLTSVNAAAFARFTNALNVAGLNVETKLTAQKNSKGPSKLHPKGSTTGLNVGAKWNVCPNLRLKGSWDMSRVNKSHPNFIAIDEFLNNPNLQTPILGSIINDTLWIHRVNLGGRYNFSRNLDLSAGWMLIKRRGLVNTDFHEQGSPYYLWDTELNQNYILRYHPAMHGFNPGDFELKYVAKHRSNDQRSSSDNDNHFTINWTGMLTDNLWAYLGGGWLDTSSKTFELTDLAQRGREYGGGFQWTVTPKVNVYGNYWKYSVSKADGFDNRTYDAGLEYQATRNWAVALEYGNNNGNFDILTDLNFDARILQLKTTYEW